ncbi:acyl-CoA dehydrogenase [Hufsiella ginkgonis]|uniref:Acyl-CoA dehydrogenase n=1 Tax=Hufsiella ginkgonis TaxID=2695274 RepID=A0A7K1XWS8_9SPHI|nr:acyl-CoA dehydrogenase [Hufsiella ginkgonis]MXV14966.1 acyl-CoA dehydrogenase [Hufsiella ginkgonis]
MEHPSALLQPRWTDIIRNHSADAEKFGALRPEQLGLIYQQNWFNLFVPASLNGLQLPLPEAVRLEEAFAWADGAFGWTLTLCSGAAWFAGFLDPALAKVVFDEKTACLGGSGAPSGTAERTPEGYVVNGSWKYATGAPHLTWFTANCLLTEHGNVLKDAGGKSLMRPFIFKREEVTVSADWQTSGLVATASHSFEVNALAVPAERQFEISPATVKTPGPSYTYPFLQLAEATLAANISGMAVHFMDLCEASFNERMKSKSFTAEQKQYLSDLLSRCRSGTSKRRAEFYRVIDQSWSYTDQGLDVPSPLLTGVSAASRVLARKVRRFAEKLYPFCGLAAADPSSEINRVWRDLHTASQHTLLIFPE